MSNQKVMSPHAMKLVRRIDKIRDSIPSAQQDETLNDLRTCLSELTDVVENLILNNAPLWEVEKVSD